MSKSKETLIMEVVLSYLNRQNRPYSVLDVFNNLHKEYGKTAVTKAIEQLSQDGKIVEKTYGKQKIYFANQSQFPDVEEKELNAMDAEILTLSGTLKEIQSSVRSKESLLEALNSSMITEEIEVKLKELNKDIVNLKTKLNHLKSTTVYIDPVQKNKIYTENEKCVKEWRKRKRVANDVIEAILEGYPKGKKTLLEEIGIETDEDANVAVP
ncbi:homologous-pairing protein 2 homolog [Limulus polyphemus]|uniref:Homologous-pairing protein 2 homolog n=1 Tax=Limulus polyphemus TaxID=6850 RepID=A0ABM1SU18_LIMPO|nr:homologous-pairing protein 2 homolog [Limulus polyphemus]